MGTYPVLPMVLRLSLSLVSVAPRWPWPLGAYPVPLDTLPRSSSRRVLLGSCCGQFAPQVRSTSCPLLKTFFHGSPFAGILGRWLAEGTVNCVSSCPSILSPSFQSGPFRERGTSAEPASDVGLERCPRWDHAWIVVLVGVSNPRTSVHLSIPHVSMASVSPDLFASEASALRMSSLVLPECRPSS
jgi:hypothetical protein